LLLLLYIYITAFVLSNLSIETGPVSKITDLFYFHFFSYFYFYFYLLFILDLELEFSMLSHITITNWHIKLSQVMVTWSYIAKNIIEDLLGVVHTGVEVCRMDLEISGLAEQPWLQLMCCTICLPHGRNFRWWEEVRDGSECWWMCRRWIPEIEFNKRLSLSIIRLVNYNVTTSLLYKVIV